MQPNKDSFLVGALGGLIGTVPMLLVAYIFYKLGLAKYLLAEVAASIFVDPSQAGLPISLLIGYMANFVIGGILGVGLIFLYRLTGYDYFYIKSVAYGALVWITVWGLVPNVHLSRIIVLDPMHNFVAFIDRVLFAVTAAWAIKYLQERNIVKS